MKKGFTLVEIILSVSLILIIGLTTTFFIVNNKNDKNLEKVTKQVLEAANLYAKLEKDENGEVYLNEVLTDKKGVKIPLSNLVNKGYIDENIKQEVIDLSNKGNDYNYYVMLLDGSPESIDYCGEGVIFTVASWVEVDKDKDVYLCNKANNTIINIVEAQENIRLNPDLNKFAVSQEYYDNATDAEKAYLTADENGIFTYYNEYLDMTYSYYRGAVDNNYVQLGKDADSNPLLWRILWVRDKQQMKLVLDDTIPIVLTNRDGELIQMKDGDEITKHRTYIFLNAVDRDPNINYDSRMDEDPDTSLKTWKINSSSQWFSDNHWYDENMYQNILQSWYNSTDLDTFTYISSQNNFCNNTCMDDDGEKYYPSNNFNCLSGYDECSYVDYTNYNNNKVGLLSYGDAIRAGMAKSGGVSSLNTSGNYLLTKNENIILSDRNAEYDRDLSYYYVSHSAGITTYYQFEKFKYESDYRDYWGWIIDENDNLVYDGWIDTGYSFYLTNFKSNSLKPVIVIDLSTVKLSNANGTKTNPYTFVQK